MSSNQMKWLWSLTALALLIMLLYLGNHLQELTQVDDTRVPGCVVTEGSCIVEISPEQRLKVSLSPWPILALQPVSYTVMSEGIGLESARLALTGKNMYMGIHQYTMMADASQQQLNVTGTISVCTERVMPWRGRMDLETSNGPQQVWFDFNVHQY